MEPPRYTPGKFKQCEYCFASSNTQGTTDPYLVCRLNPPIFYNEDGADWQPVVKKTMFCAQFRLDPMYYEAAFNEIGE
jgi:hypothetical protein